MKKIIILLIPILIVIFVSFEKIEQIWSQNQKAGSSASLEIKESPIYKYPDFYRGMYLNNYSARNMKKFNYFIKQAKKSHINAMVLDVQNKRIKLCSVPKKNVDICLKNGIHPIARIVVFNNGLKKWPVPEKEILERLKTAEDACKKGFKEIQFDYIRFSDYRISRKLSYNEKYAFIEGFLARARKYLKKYEVKTAADIFGRIPLNTRDKIGQRMEGLDKVVDIICPMAYPSHYTWTKKYLADPYHTVYITSKRAKERTKESEIVSYIQAFEMKLSYSKLSFAKYIEVQIKAVHDAGIRGFIMWNARQKYKIPLMVTKNFYNKNGSKFAANKEKE